MTEIKHLHIKFLRFAVFLLFISLASSCRPDANQTRLISPESTSDDSVISRFDQLIMHSDSTQLMAYCDEYPTFCALYFREVLRIDVPISDARFWENLALFRQDSMVLATHSLIRQRFSDMSQHTFGLDLAIAKIESVWPGYPIGKVHGYLGPFTYQLFVFEEDRKTSVGVGLDLFLHPDLNYKEIDPKNPVFSQYLVERYSPDYFSVKILDVLLDDLIPPLQGSQRLLDHMIRNGKKRWLIKELLPKTDGYISMDMTQENYDWCMDNEREIWSYLVGNQLIYNSEISKINKYVNPSPDSPGMPKDAPGRTANFIGLQIVNGYMVQNDVSWTDLVSQTDAQKILDASKYRPK